eukprot:TRINITY_DN9400_c0_g1_i1.p1 TRINITY_DN9400_c0_g1~~TRINITY_DN9400_c0_g1_i1.p1  ORF type:complete len:205 (-),score=101.15 TRINITY_DN9400_c0_g1_i1:250-864(-)
MSEEGEKRKDLNEEDEDDEDDDDFAPSDGEDDDQYEKEVVSEGENDEEDNNGKKRKASSEKLEESQNKSAKTSQNLNNEKKVEETNQIKPSTRSSGSGVISPPLSVAPKKSAAAPVKASVKVAKGSTNLDKLLTGLGGGKKTTTLKKSQEDWNKFKKQEGIESELQQATKGGGYLEKQAFLQRTDLRVYENEREIKLKNFGKPN